MNYICPICKKSFDNCRKYGGHLSRHSKEDKNQFKMQPKIFTKYTTFDEDKPCQYCNKLYSNSNSLMQHEIRCKKNPQKISLTYLDGGKNFSKYNKNRKSYVYNKSFSCRFCGLKVKNPQILGGHAPWCSLNPNREITIQKIKDRLRSRNQEQKNLQAERQSNSLTKAIVDGKFSPLSHFKSGSINFEKCRNHKPLFYRSNLERLILTYIESHDIFDYYDYESLRIPYVHKDISLKTVVDLVCYKDNISTIIEIKPWEYLSNPETCYDEKIIPKLRAIYEYSKLNNISSKVFSVMNNSLISLDLISYFDNGWNNDLINEIESL